MRAQRSVIVSCPTFLYILSLSCFIVHRQSSVSSSSSDSYCTLYKSIKRALYATDIPYMFQYGDNVHPRRSVLFDLDKVIATQVARRLDYVNWFHRQYGVCVLELVLYTPYSDLITQVAVLV